MRDPAFFHLRNKDASVTVKDVTFGYYAMSPTDFQRLYVPVWAIDATSQTRELRYDFRRYVVAVDMTPEDAKRADAVANPRACRLF
jgi:regulatory protein YycI of two-component signal transduction system YycFG